MVDDEADIVEMLTLLLEKDGHRITPASNGKEALEKIAQDRPDLILLDLMMPVMDGYQMHAQLVENEATRSIPIVIVTAKGKSRSRFEGISNIAAYIDKPFDPKSLREKIREILAKN